MEVWKEFDHNVITHSAAHHLMAIAQLLRKNGYARVTDVAKKLSITRGSASITLKALKERGLVKEDENKFLLLSEKGQKLTSLIYSKRKILIKFFRDVLMVSEETAEIDACKIEHLISTHTGERLLHFMNFLLNDQTKADDLLKAFKTHAIDCHDISTCNICDDECFLNESGHEVIQITR